MEIAKVYPLDAVYDNPEDVPEDVREKSLSYQNKQITFTKHTIF